MESQEMLDRDRIFSGNGNGNGSNGYGLVDKEGCAGNGSEDRLLISRMVSNSVIKGMVNAVEPQAAEKIAAKELEMAYLKEFLRFYNAGPNKIDCLGSSMDKNELLRFYNAGPNKIDCLGSSMDKNELEVGNDCAKHLSFEEACLKHDMMMESLKGLRSVADLLLKKLKNGIHSARSRSIRKTKSGSELVGLGGILLEKDSKSWVHVDEILDSLNMLVENLCSQASSTLMLSKSSLCDWYLQRDLQSQLEAMVMQSLILSIQEDFEQKLWDQSSQLRSSQSVNWIEKLNQISSLRMELDAILKSLSNGDAHRSHDADHSHRKVSSNHVTSSSIPREENGKVEDLDSNVPESYDAAQLKHLRKEELVAHFNMIITKMRREHESVVYDLTEECFSLKREYLKDRGFSLLHKKDKEFDILRKKISDIILELDDILMEKEKLPGIAKDADDFSDLKYRLDSLLSENHQLRDSLRDKKGELKCMSSQLSDATEKMLQHSAAEANMSKLIGKLNSDLVDAHIEAAIKQDVQNCVLLELIGEVSSDTEELDLEILLKQEIYDIVFSGGVADNEATESCTIEDSDVQNSITEGVCNVIFKETLKDSWKELKELYGKYLIEKEKRNYLEMEGLGKENELEVVAQQSERLKQELSVLTNSLDEKEKVATDISAALAKEREQFELASKERDTFREEANLQRMLASGKIKELNLVRSQLAGALHQIESDKVEIQKLNQKLEQALKDLGDASEQKKMVIALTQEKRNYIELAEAKEKELKIQTEAVMLGVQGLSKMLVDFEFKISGKIKENKLRIEDSFSELSSLLKKAKLLKRTGLLYKQKLEWRWSDLQTAEAEVDLLGDEVDTLLNLLEKIYIALDHYSPILKHYPGIMEILKLIRRELSGESTEPA